MGSAKWLEDAGDKYGGGIAAPSAPATREATAVTTVAPVVKPSLAGFTHPGDPVFWFGVVAAVGVGLMAYSTVSVS